MDVWSQVRTVIVFSKNIALYSRFRCYYELLHIFIEWYMVSYKHVTEYNLDVARRDLLTAQGPFVMLFPY